MDSMNDLENLLNDLKINDNKTNIKYDLKKIILLQKEFKKYIIKKRLKESNNFIEIIKESYLLYFKHGSRSSKKVDYFHNFIKNEIMKIIKKLNKEDVYKVFLEKSVKSYNSSGKKKCDIVITKNNEDYIIFPVKIIMSNFKQNKNNSWECLTGELIHMKWLNPNLYFIPINIFIDKTPYLNKNGNIQKFEIINYDDISQYNLLKTNNIVYENINYILNVNHNSQINEKYEKIPEILSFNNKTKYISLELLLLKILF
jgi:hypothetical protein